MGGCNFKYIRNTNHHEESIVAVVAFSSSFQVGSENKGQGLNPNGSGTPPNFLCQMVTRNMLFKAEEKEELHIDDDDVFLPAIIQIPHKT